MQTNAAWFCLSKGSARLQASHHTRHESWKCQEQSLPQNREKSLRVPTDQPANQPTTTTAQQLPSALVELQQLWPQVVFFSFFFYDKHHQRDVTVVEQIYSVSSTERDLFNCTRVKVFIILQSVKLLQTEMILLASYESACVWVIFVGDHHQHRGLEGGLSVSWPSWQRQYCRVSEWTGSPPPSDGYECTPRSRAGEENCKMKVCLMAC